MAAGPDSAARADAPAVSERTGLPPQPNRFVNRHRELVELLRLLPGTRLLCLLGPIGTGKTRLGLRLAELAQTGFQHGAWLVELAPVSEGALVPTAILRALGLVEDRRGDAVPVLEHVLEARQTLLVLDNCEHLAADVASLVDRLLRACPGLTVLATSRERLGVPGELIWRVPPLAVPGRDRSYPAPELAAVDSVALFLDRARQANPRFRAGPGDLVSVAELVRRLEGLPLAIELAAGWMPTLGPADLLERLDDRFQVLVARGSRAGGRHSSLRTAIDASYESLGPSQQRLFRQLAHFKGGFDIDSMVAVTGLEPGAAIEQLGVLVDRSMVTAAPPGEGTTRYRLLEALREYAAARLREAGEDAAARGQFTRHFATFAERAGAGLTRADGARWLRLLDAEADNVGLLFDLHVPDAADVRLRLAVALVPYWYFRGFLSSARQRLLQAVASAPAPTPVLVAALNGLSRLAWGQGDLLDAARQAGRALALARRIRDRAGAVGALLRLAQASFDSGRTDRAQAWSERALVEAAALRDDRLVAAASLQLGQVALVDGRYGDAERLIDESIERCRLAGDAGGETTSWLIRGRLLLSQGAPDKAEAALKRCLVPVRDLLLPRQLIPILESLAAAAAARGDTRRAARLAGAADGLLDRIGARPPATAPMRTSLSARWRPALTVAGGHRAWAEGRAMDLATATAYALGEEGALGGQPAAGIGIAAARTPLTRRQLEVARLVADGLTNREIGLRLFVSERTAEGHVERIRKRLGFTSRVQIAAWLARTVPGPGSATG